MSAEVPVTTWYLEQRDPADLRAPRRPPDLPVEVRRVEGPRPELNRRLYETVGADWHWTDRLTWSDAEWRAWLERPGVETWVARHRDEVAGYVELDSHPSGQVEIAYFGLLPAYLGRGIGGHLLATGTRQAWSLADRWPGREPTRRVWVHTCSLDGPAALPNYRARGFSIYKTVTRLQRLDPRPGS